jgi:ADP-heptose:LPS heptosyltransferase
MPRPPWRPASPAIRNLDLVISIDTAVAHLAGALGVPVWIMLRHVADWRWPAGREDSPWYPSMRLFRQEKPGEWGPVVEQVAMCLRDQTPIQAKGQLVNVSNRTRPPFDTLAPTVPKIEW